MPTVTSFPPPPGSYRFNVGSAAEAVATIRERLGETARVVSVQPLAQAGVMRLFTKPRYEVVAELPETAPPPAAAAQVLAWAREGTGPAPGLATPAETPASVERLLLRAGFSETLLGRLAARPAWRTVATGPVHRALAEVAREFDLVAARPVPPLPGRTAFIGQAGVGRTTALCKWLSHQVLDHGRAGAVWRVEFDRPNPTQQLDVFCEALGVVAEHYLPEVSTHFETDGFLLADVPALPAYSARESHTLKIFLDRERFTGRVLVLNAAYAPDVLRAALARGREWGATHLVFTHLDEVVRWGHLAEFLLDAPVPTLFLGVGPALCGELETAAAAAVGRRAFQCLHRAGVGEEVAA